MSIKNLFSPIGNWKDLSKNFTGSFEDSKEYMFSSENPEVGVLTYYIGGKIHGVLCIDSEIQIEVKKIPNWEKELSNHFTEQTGLPVTSVNVW
jgi:hypothetical protein